MGRFLPPDHAAGDERTIGGYRAVHARPPALEAADGHAYSVEVMADVVADAPVDDGARWGGYLLFLRWRRMGAQGVEGHLETPFLVEAEDEHSARAALEALSLDVAQAQLDALVAARAREAARPARRWWDMIRDEEPHDGRNAEDAGA